MSSASVLLDRGAAPVVVERHYKVREVATLLSVTPPTVYGLCDAGQLRHARIPGRGDRKTIRIPESGLQEFMLRTRCGGQQ